MKKHLQILLMALIVVIMHSACKEKIPVPYYLHIDNMSVENVDYLSHGSANSKITDVWVYADNKFVGAYVLPANIPFISDKQLLEVRAGISENGINNRRTAYSFYQFKTIPVDWVKGAYKTINPVVSYRTNTKLIVHEDFEAGTNFETQNNSAPIISIVDTNKYEGTASAAVTMDTSKQTMDILITKPLILPLGRPYFLEMNYKSDCLFEVALITKTNTQTTVQELGTINPRSSWNKIYFNVETRISSLQGISYQLNIRSVLPSGKQKATVYLDNIKLLGLQ